MVQVVPALPPFQSTESRRASGIAVWPLVLSSLCMVSVCGLLVIAGANSDATAVRAQLALDMQPHAHVVSSVSGLTRADHRYSRLLKETDNLHSALLTATQQLQQQPQPQQPRGGGGGGNLYGMDGGVLSEGGGAFARDVGSAGNR